MGCLDPYHLVAWVSDALDAVRRQVWNTARGGKGGRNHHSKKIKGARWALWKNPENLTDKQTVKLAELLKYNLQTVRGYLLREDFQRFWEYQPGLGGPFPRRTTHLEAPAPRDGDTLAPTSYCGGGLVGCGLQSPHPTPR